MSRMHEKKSSKASNNNKENIDEREVNKIVAQRERKQRSKQPKETGVGAGARAVTKAVSKAQKEVLLAKKSQQAQGNHFVSGPSRKAVRSSLAKVGMTDDTPSLKAWAACASNPFANPAARCPVQVNPVPTLRTTTATTVYKGAIGQAAYKQRVFLIWPGHGEMPENIDPAASVRWPYNMDDVSFHAGCARVGTTGGNDIFSIGPLDWADSTGTYTRKNAIGTTFESDIDANLPGSMINAAFAPITTVTPLPYRTGGGKGYHSRWRLLGIAVKIICKDYNDALEIASVMPYSRNPAPLSTDTFDSFYVNDPSYKVTQVTPVAGKAEWEVVVPYQMSQLGFWHTAGDESQYAFTNPFTSPGLAFCVKTASTGASYDYQIVCHWELGGKSLNSISQPTFQSASHTPVIERAAQTIRTAEGGAGAPSLMHHIGSALEAVAHEGISAATEFGLRALRSFAVGLI